MVHRVLAETAVRGHPCGPVPLGPVAVVEARRIPAHQATVATAAAAVRLDAHPVTDRELIDSGAENGHGSSPFVARRVVPERRGLREMAVIDLQIGPAGAAHRD